jgi:hypothetical protein
MSHFIVLMEFIQLIIITLQYLHFSSVLFSHILISFHVLSLLAVSLSLESQSKYFIAQNIILLVFYTLYTDMIGQF